jgi:hypothetical protein
MVDFSHHALDDASSYVKSLGNDELRLEDV